MNIYDNSGLALTNMLSVSVAQIILVVSIIAIFLILEKYRFAVVTVYLFCMHWAFVSQQVVLTQHFGDSSSGIFMFMFLGFSIAVVGVLSIFQQDNYS